MRRHFSCSRPSKHKTCFQHPVCNQHQQHQQANSRQKTSCAPRPLQVSYGPLCPDPKETGLSSRERTWQLSEEEQLQLQLQQQQQQQQRPHSKATAASTAAVTAPAAADPDPKPSMQMHDFLSQHRLGSANSELQGITLMQSSVMFQTPVTKK